MRPSEAWTRAGAWSYLRRWHTGNGSGRSSLCCSSPRWRLPPGSGNISERKGEVRRVSTPDSALSLQAVPRPHWSDVACVLVVAGGVVNFQLPLTGHKGRRPRSQDSGRTTELLTNKPNRTRVGQAARPWPFRSPPRQMPARPLLSFPPYLELPADPAPLFLLLQVPAEEEGKIVELYINLSELNVEFGFQFLYL